MTDNVITIDGLSYVGKSTIARSLAKLTGFTYINTGHMYRALAKLVLDHGLMKDMKRLLHLANEMKFEFRYHSDGSHIIVNGKDWTAAVDDEAVVRFAPEIAVIPEIRNILTQRQKEYAHTKTIIMEGRDIGTAVFPNARWKFFVSASFEVRAKRMHKRLSPEEQSKTRLDDPMFLERLKRLDDSDLNRPISPLRKAENAIEYDNSLSPTEEEDALILFYGCQCPKEIINDYMAYSDATLQKARLCLEKGEMIRGNHR